MRPHWDALSDSLYGGIGALDERRVAVVWLQADVLLAHDAEVLYIALDCFRDAAAALDKPPEPVELKVFLVGAGPSFKPDTAQVP